MTPAVMVGVSLYGAVKMGSNQYGSWDDKAMSKLERKQQRARTALIERQTKAMNKLYDKLDVMKDTHRNELNALRVKHREEQDELVTLTETPIPRCSCGGDCQRCTGRCKCSTCSHKHS